ncbi:uncharacterized protein LOC114183803 [Vigna unguiculata]|uniref:Uncharacterized protein n=1 Tax=Vigna unguiculata TaxID=3917 RepID=A0A4D6NBD5_VIGUN|nr:uncharacterized protein LOC114183803 [Vigna unguiculata]QCE09869.1 hypothetical protein DEO72_LG10g1092 [Vigna unguiculata]
MAKNRNKKKRNGVVSMDTSDAPVSEQPQAMDTSESGVQNAVSGAINMKMKQKGRPMKRSKNVRKMKAIAKAVSANEKSIEKVSKNENKRSRVKSAKSLYE